MKKETINSCSLKSFAGLLFLFISVATFAQRNPILGAGNSYVNISKKNIGGVVQTGDTLEIRTTYFFGPSYNSLNANTLYQTRYYDSVPLQTEMLTAIDDSLRLITNEGITFRKYTLASSDDPANYRPFPTTGRYQIRINIGQHNLVAPGTPGTTSAGLITNVTGAGNVRIGAGATRYKPQIFGGLLLTTAFRVRVTGNSGDTIVLAEGKLVYRKTDGGTDTIITATPYKILISANNATGLCGNALGTNLATEAGGTFGSGSTHNRVAGPVFPIPNYDYRILTRAAPVGDGNYSFVNNLSPVGGTNFNARSQPNCNLPAGPIPVNDSCVKRMFSGFWDIIGDHTGTTTAAGNPAVAPGLPGGYMLSVNSDVVTSEAYRQDITGLCTNTYYEFSAWIRNVCKRCAIDSNSTSLYNPGVLPNLAFSVNGLDIYSTGEVDTIGWQKKGFVFQTGPSQTTASISIRNNAPGGGGNDWVIDDIAIGTCGPSMNFNFRPFFTGCSTGSTVDLSDTIRYTYNPSYAWYRWERSTDNGVTWGAPPVPTTGFALIGAPVNGSYQFVTNYPTFLATGADSGHRYRVVVATSNANLGSTSCSFTDGQFVTLNIMTCPPVLKGKTFYFNARLKNDKPVLNWKISNESNMSRYEIERSLDGINFIKIAEVRAKNSNALSDYEFEDADAIKGNTYFRLKIFNDKEQYGYSKIVLLNYNYNFTVNGLINPFTDHISADVIAPADGIINMTLMDGFGKLLGKEAFRLTKGFNKVTYSGLSNLSTGTYLIRFEYNNSFVIKKVTKLSQ